MVSLSEKLKGAVEEYALERNASLEDGLKVNRASLNGDSFAADVFRISIAGKPQDENGKATPGAASESDKPVREVRLIAKVAPKLKFRREMYNIPMLFEREKFMYTKLLPEFKKFQLQHLLTGEAIFDNYPQLIKTSDVPFDEFILLKDICDEGYGNFDRTKGASLEVCKLVLQKFAQFHAISFVYQANDKQRFQEMLSDNLKETLFVQEIPESFQLFLQNKVDLIREKIGEYPEVATDELVLKRMQLFRENCVKEMFEACSVQDHAVICHGDPWISNIMFKEIGKDQFDIKFIDFQVSRFTTPVVDLSYFLVCSTDRELRQNLPELLLHYYTHLMREIRLLGHSSPESLYPYDIYTSHCAKFMKFGFGMAMMSMHSITCLPENMPDVILMLETCDFEKIDELTKILSKNPAYCKRITDLVRDMVSFGYL